MHHAHLSSPVDHRGMRHSCTLVAPSCCEEVFVDNAILELLQRLAKFGEDNDARESARPERMLNITRDTGRLLWIIAAPLAPPGS